MGFLGWADWRFLWGGRLFVLHLLGCIGRIGRVGTGMDWFRMGHPGPFRYRGRGVKIATRGSVSNYYALPSGCSWQ